MIMMIIGLFAVYISLVQADEVVMTTSGPVQGVTAESDGMLVEAYLGVPYAEPPVGRLRFAKPVPKTHWEGVYDASRLPPPCIQNITRPAHFAPDISNMSEDCLYLNIWVPRSQVDTRLKAVLFFIHGGAFVLGSSNMKLYDGAKLAARGDIVVVTINYRLGALGFLLASIDDAGGNMGLRDQILALKWIRSNAMSFHGDPDNIVAMGQSAGAMSVSGLIMSPVSKHMIKRAIFLSGTPMTPLVLDGNDKLHKVSQKFATLVGCADKKVTLVKYPRKIVKCLKSVPTTEISRVEGILTALNPITFIPRMEDDILPMNTVEMIRNGELKHAEMLIGVMKDEGALFLTAAAPEYFGMYDSDTVTVGKHMASQMMKMTQKMLGVEGSKKVADFYVGRVENGTSEKYLAAISEFVGDLMITCTSIFQAEFHSVGNPVYFYKLTHRSKLSPLADWMSVVHFDDLQYVFGNPMFGNFTDEDQILSNRIMDRCISFAKTGNPNIQGEVKWPMFTYKNPQYLEINMKERVLSRPDNYRCEFWRQIFQAEMDDNVIQRLRSSAATFTSKFIYLVMPMFLLMRHKI